MKMNKLRLTNKIENHFYLDFNWKEESIYDYCLCSWKRGSRHGKNPPNFFERLTRFGSIFIIIFVKLTF